MDIYILGEHLLISIVPWFIGVALGGWLGTICTPVVRSLFSSNPGLRRGAMLLPWRTVAVTLAAVVFLSPIVAIFVGLGRAAGMISVGLFVFVFALPFTVGSLLEQWYPSSSVVRLISGSRTLATTSIAVALVTDLSSGSGGFGSMIFGGITRVDKAQINKGFLMVALVALVIDILLGLLQMETYRNVLPTSNAGSET